VFIFANLPPLTSDPKCGLSNTGYVELPRHSVIPFVEMKWGDSLFDEFPKGVSLDIDIEVTPTSSGLSVKVSLTIKTPLGDRSVSLPEVTLGADGVCASVTTGDSNPYADARVCWNGPEVCADVTAGVKIGGKKFETSGRKCVGVSLNRSVCRECKQE